MNGSSRRVIVLVCEECGERTVLGGPLSVWYSQSTRFGCGCGRELTLADRLDQLRVGRARDVMSAEGPASPLYR
jgi:hypothetical protein